ncbi:MAG: MFS transporter [Elusimicrobia bacterium]|nr:MFS transporter [Elusimicrobiota bacterium]
MLPLGALLAAGLIPTGAQAQSSARRPAPARAALSLRARPPAASLGALPFSGLGPELSLGLQAPRLSIVPAGLGAEPAALPEASAPAPAPASAAREPRAAPLVWFDPGSAAGEVRVAGRPTAIAAEVRALRRAFAPARADALEALGAAPGGRRSVGLRLAAAELQPEPRRAPALAGKPLPAGGAPSRPRLGAAARAFILSLVVGQVGVQAWSATWARWVQGSYGAEHYSLTATISLFASLAAGYAGGWAADRWGLKGTYATSLLAVAGATAAILLLAKATLLPFAALAALAAAATFVLTAGATAAQTVPALLFQGDGRGLRRFNSVSQLAVQLVGVAVPSAIGAVLLHAGPLATMASLPAALLVSALLFLAWVPLKEGGAKASRARAAAAAPVAAAARDPFLARVALSAYPAFLVLPLLLYNIVAIGYGNLLHPGAAAVDAAAAAGVAGRLVGFFSLGGLLAALRASAAGRRVEPLPPGGSRERALRAAYRRTLLGMLGVAGALPLLGASPLWAALGMIPFGYTNMLAQLELLSLLQEHAPERKQGRWLGLAGTAATLAAAAGILAFGQAAQAWAAPAAFRVLLAGVGLIAAYCGGVGVLLRRELARASAP